LTIASILHREKEAGKLRSEAEEVVSAVNQTYDLRQGKLQEFRKLEQTVRRKENEVSEK